MKLVVLLMKMKLAPFSSAFPAMWRHSGWKANMWAHPSPFFCGSTSRNSADRPNAPELDMATSVRRSELWTFSWYCEASPYLSSLGEMLLSWEKNFEELMDGSFPNPWRFMLKWWFMGEMQALSVLSVLFLLFSHFLLLDHLYWKHI